MSKGSRKIGFDGRVFLEETEWRTYCRRKPVRYIRHPKAIVCCVCGLPGSEQNPLQNAHIIGFDMGVVDFALTPDFLDSAQNIVTAHRRGCNKKTEVNLKGAVAQLVQLRVSDLPAFLPSEIHALWKPSR
jgi:hypothetical protein